MDEFKQNQTLVLALVGIGVVIVIIGLWFAWATASRHRSERKAILRDREMAVIAERVETTGGGRLCILLLVLTVIGTVIAYSQATTVFQQIQAGVSFIGGCILFGLGAALGRSRTYRVYRSEQRME
ncbi:hypothetical protein [Bradyrhizobium sp. AUGA SZCCT0283]|uniref:hypothetical protein n=1 Tax=Bradyrhizobium sp. AUGA SZCCT0283 TaxID=2807671 RepID=UPI001BACE643|nr:hypothetical protein [Bradyrhizobium sp. AUGA SZCCT0283]MBR1280351.1 hypothetical protein [Bradyrhizobium sp. AUGA SZCCT0283]